MLGMPESFSPAMRSITACAQSCACSNEVKSDFRHRTFPVLNTFNSACFPPANAMNTLTRSSLGGCTTTGPENNSWSGFEVNIIYHGKNYSRNRLVSNPVLKSWRVLTFQGGKAFLEHGGVHPSCASYPNSFHCWHSARFQFMKSAFELLISKDRGHWFKQICVQRRNSIGLNWTAY